MFGKKSKKDDKPSKISMHRGFNSLEIEVLQNGFKIADYYSESVKARFLNISSFKSADIYLPNYKAIWEEDFLEVRRNGSLKILVTPGMEGFVKLSDEVFDLDPASKTNRVLELVVGDQASIGIGDLHFLIKLNSQTKKNRINLPSQIFTSNVYRGSFFADMLRDKFQRNTWVIAGTCAAFLAFMIHIGLKNRPDDLPKQLNDLPERFTLQFIHPTHFATAPEALQHDLNRGDYIGSVTSFYSTLASMLNGKEIIPKIHENLMFANSLKEWKEKHIEYHIQEEKFLEQNLKPSLPSQAKNRIFLATVLGSSLEEKRKETLEKITTWQNFLQENLEDKRGFLQEFAKDQPYDFADHKSVAQPINKDAKEKLSQIRVFNKLTDEELMYFEANELATKAKDQQNKIRLNLSNTHHETYKIVLAPELKSIGFNSDLLEKLSDELLDKIEAHPFGVMVSKIKKEPLIGSLDPKLVESVVMKNRFQLQLCFELALRRNEETEGSMEWSWRLDSKGDISDLALISSNIEDPRMLECVKQSISSWAFPRPSNGSVVIRYPFQFSPARG